MKFGQPATPGMTLNDTQMTVSANLGVSTLVASGAASFQNSVHCSGIISNSALSVAGVHIGNESTVGFARACLTCSGTSSRSLLDFSYAGHAGWGCSKIGGSAF